jgi:hypothetical protein
MILEEKPSAGHTIGSAMHYFMDVSVILMGFLFYYEGDRIFMKVVGVLCFGAAIWHAWKDSWPSSLALRIELVSSPREARCRREHGITRRWSLRTYPIAADAKVEMFCFPETAESAAYYQIRIDGVPKYYNLYALAYGQSGQEAYQIARTAAYILGIRLFVDYKEVPVHGGNLFIPHGPRSKEEERRARKIRWRRNRKRKPK